VTGQTKWRRCVFVVLVLDSFVGTRWLGCILHLIVVLDGLDFLR
jgi:hypothetical protein